MRAHGLTGSHTDAVLQAKGGVGCHGSPRPDMRARQSGFLRIVNLSRVLSLKRTRL